MPIRQLSASSTRFPQASDVTRNSVAKRNLTALSSQVLGSQRFHQVLLVPPFYTVGFTRPLSREATVNIQHIAGANHWPLHYFTFHY
jgi:hypothetical protein